MRGRERETKEERRKESKVERKKKRVRGREEEVRKILFSLKKDLKEFTFFDHSLLFFMFF